MANIASQIKRNETNEKARQQNFTFKAQMRTAIKKVVGLATQKTSEAYQKALSVAIKLIDKSVSKGIQTKATAARQKSRLYARLAKIKA